MTQAVEKISEPVPFKQRVEFSSVIVLRYLLDSEAGFSTLLEGDDTELEPLLDSLNRQGFVDIDDENLYQINDKGVKVVERFADRFRDFVATMDVYAAIDLDEGVFAFERFFDFEHEDDFGEYLAQERWNDLRIAVAKFKGLDPLQIVFMAAVNDGTLDETENGWQKRLLADDFWQELQGICSDAVNTTDLQDEGTGDDETVSGDDILKEIIKEGAELNLKLKKQEDELNAEQGLATTGDSANDDVEEVYTVEEYRCYADPYFVAPIWGGFWFY